MTLTPTQSLHPWRTKYGSWAVVTGASEGIGREFAVCPAKAGLNLVLIARRSSVLEELSAELTKSYPINIRILAADLSQQSAVEAVIAATQPLDVGLLVACAGFGTAGDFIDQPLERELQMLDVNCRAVVMMSHHFGQRFAQQRRGGIVLMSSLVAFQGVPRAANYAATKAFIQTLAEGLYLELAPFGVEVAACAPGPVASGFATQADMQMGFALKPAQVAQGTMAALGKRLTLRPGWLSKALEYSLAFLPRWWRVRAMQQVMKGMTKHQTRPTLTTPVSTQSVEGVR